MSAIIKKQYQTAKQILSTLEVIFEERKRNPNFENWKIFQDMYGYFKLIVGEVQVGYYTVLPYGLPENMDYIGHANKMFLRYEAELKASGLLDLTFEEILEQREEPAARQEPVYTDEQKCQMWYERQKQMDYDTQF
jgi:hypothetical protein